MRISDVELGRMKQDIEVLAGRRGNSLDAAVTRRSLNLDIQNQIAAAAEQVEQNLLNRLSLDTQRLNSIIANKAVFAVDAVSGETSIDDLVYLDDSDGLPAISLNSITSPAIASATDTVSLDYNVAEDGTDVKITVSVLNRTVTLAGGLIDPIHTVTVDGVDIIGPDAAGELLGLSTIVSLDAGTRTISASIGTASTGSYTGLVLITAQTCP